jgi:hypothetical protein
MPAPAPKFWLRRAFALLALGLLALLGSVPVARADELPTCGATNLLAGNTLVEQQNVSGDVRRVTDGAVADEGAAWDASPAFAFRGDGSLTSTSEQRSRSAPRFYRPTPTTPTSSAVPRTERPAATARSPSSRTWSSGEMAYAGGSLSRRNNRGLDWERMQAILNAFPLLRPRVVHSASELQRSRDSKSRMRESCKSGSVGARESDLPGPPDNAVRVPSTSTGACRGQETLVTVLSP